jgi:DNA-binding transcriptional ArsR family regulator
MQELSERKSKILDVLDEEIKALEKKLERVQPLVDELNQLRKTRMTLLSERSVTGAVSNRTQLTMESVIQAMRSNNAGFTAGELAEGLGVDASVVRSHLNRYNETRYRKNGEGKWYLIGEQDDEEDE